MYLADQDGLEIEHHSQTYHDHCLYDDKFSKKFQKNYSLQDLCSKYGKLQNILSRRE